MPLPLSAYSESITPTSQLWAIVCTDLQGSTAATQQHETRVLEQIAHDLALMEATCVDFGGQRVASMGDGCILVFPAASYAVAWAVATQQRLGQVAPAPDQDFAPDHSHSQTPAPQRLLHRIGIHLGELDPNQALDAPARLIADQLQHLAEPGGICLSRAVYDTVSSHLPFYFSDGGLHRLEGLPHDLRVYQLSPLALAQSPACLAPDRLDRRNLRVVAFTSVYRYAEQLQQDQEHLLRCVRRDFEQLAELCQQYQGEVIKSLGSGLLVVFASAKQATHWAIAAQQRIQDQRAKIPPTAILHHQIGLHLGDVEIIDSDIAGHTVNFAARLLGHTPQNGICLARSVYDVVASQMLLPLNPKDNQVVDLKGIEHPVSVYPMVLSQLTRSQVKPRWAARTRPTLDNPATRFAPNPAPNPATNPAPIAQVTNPPIAATAESMLAAYAAGDRNFAEHRCEGFQFANAVLVGANLSRGNFHRANFEAADLTGVDLSRSDLREANLARVNLTRVYCNYTDFSGANLQGANLSDAHLTNSQFQDTDLRGANLTSARISDFQLSLALTDHKTIYPNGQTRKRRWQF
ncbi:MAG: pentapeptide repeat-containing protein [Prochlorothrix sp.]